jgi:hypothetical protein
VIGRQESDLPAVLGQILGETGLLQQLKQHQINCHEDAAVIRDVLSRVDVSVLDHAVKTGELNDIDSYYNASSSEQVNDMAILKKFLLSLTLKDLSIMIIMRRHNDGEPNEMNSSIINGKIDKIDVEIKLLDVDRKGSRNIQKALELEAKLLAYYTLTRLSLQTDKKCIE